MSILESHGKNKNEVLALTLERQQADKYHESSKNWGGIYHDSNTPEGKELEELQGEVLKSFTTTNALYPGMWPSVQRFEAELVQLVIQWQSGVDVGAVGLLTSGGTESILLAVLSYREHAKHSRGVSEPEIIAAVTAHPAIDKACHYFGIKLLKLPVDASLRLDLKAVQAAMTSSTILIYASAPTFPHGMLDPISELSDIALAHPGVGLHVDNCLGGVLLSYMSAQGLFTRPWDYRVAGVTSISTDLHKYGYAPKGCSAVTWRHNELRRATLHPVVANVSGGFYITPTLQGSRNGAAIASAWATVKFVGEEGYRRAAKNLAETLCSMQEGVRRTEGVRLLCESEVSILAVASESFSVAKLAKAMGQRGWSMFTAQNPPCISVCLGEQHVSMWREWLNDFQECTQQIMQQKSGRQDVSGGSSEASIKIDGPYSAAPVNMTAKDLKNMEEKLKDYIEDGMRLPGSKAGSKL